MKVDREKVPNDELENSLPALRKQAAAAIRNVVNDLNSMFETAVRLGMTVELSDFLVAISCNENYPQLRVEMCVKEKL